MGITADRNQGKVGAADALAVTLTVDQLRSLVREELSESSAHNGKPASEVMTTDEACEFVRCSRATLNRLVAAKKIRCRRLGDSPRFIRSELIEDIRGGE